MFNQREPKEMAEAGLADAAMEDALRNFRSSIHAWSEAEFVRARTVLHSEHRRTWRRAAAWAVGCALAVGTLSAGIYEHHSHDRLARIITQRIVAQRTAAQRTLQQNQLLADQGAAPNQSAAQSPAEDALQAPAQGQSADARLMAAVDRDVSQPVPSAMEPLAQLMEESASQ